MPRRSILKAKKIRLENLNGKLVLKRDDKLSQRKYKYSSGWEFVASIDYLLKEIKTKEYKKKLRIHNILTPHKKRKINLENFNISNETYYILLRNFPKKKQIFDKYKNK